MTDKPENTLDALMDIDPLSLSDGQIDEIVRFLRQQRMMVQHGVTPKKAAKPSVDLSSVMSALTLTPKAEPEQREKRRF